MKCENCGSDNIVWDRRNGSVVCSNCGLVLDSIYDNSLSFSDEDTIIISPNFIDNIKEETKKFLSNKTHKNTVYINGSPHIISESGLIALDLISRSVKAKKVYETIENSGILSGRKIKTKVAVAFYLAGYRDEEFKKILKILGINYNYIRKIINKISKKYLYFLDN